jgi:hypothetical protein
MALIVVAFNAIEVAILKEPGTVFLSVEFPKYSNELVRMHLSLYGDTAHLFKSRTLSRLYG